MATDGSSASGFSRIVKQAGAALKLHAVDRLGPGAEIVGRPHVENLGKLRIGRHFHFVSRPAVSHLVVQKGGSLSIGDRVRIECGAAISSHLDVRIGDDVFVGPSVVIMDSDIHVIGDRSAHAIPQPVWIGRGVVIEHRVTILRGSTIGDGARVTSGSVVSGDVPAGATVAGVPASPLTSGSTTEAFDVSELVQEVFGLSARPSTSDGPDTIPQWDSLGALKLLLAVERRLGTSLGDAELRSIKSVAELEGLVERKIAAGAAETRAA